MNRAFVQRKRVAVALGALLLVACGGQIFGQTAYLQNGTDFTLYLKSGSAATYRQVPPGGLLPLVPGRDLDGFAYDRSSFQFPVIHLSAVEFAGVPVFEFGDDALRQAEFLDASDVSEIISGPRIDNQYLDWLSLPPLFARGRGRQPLGSFVATSGTRQPIPSGASLLWQRAGTDLQWMKTARIRDDLYLAASAYSVFAPTTTVNLYIYGLSPVPLASIELSTGSDSGLALMWLPVEPEPVVVGNTVAGDYFLEAQVWLDVVAATLSGVDTGGDLVWEGFLRSASELQQAPSADGGDSSLTVEIATGGSAAGVWEEFVLARVSLAELTDDSRAEGRAGDP